MLGKSSVKSELRSDTSISSQQLHWFLRRLEALSKIAEICEIDTSDVARTLVGTDHVSEIYSTEIANQIRHIDTCLFLKTGMPRQAELKDLSIWSAKAKTLAESHPDGCRSKAATDLIVDSNRISAFAEVVGSVPNDDIRYPAAHWLAEKIHGVFLLTKTEAKEPTRAQNTKLSGFGLALEVAFKAFEVKGNHGNIASIHGPAKNALTRHEIEDL